MMQKNFLTFIALSIFLTSFLACEGKKEEAKNKKDTKPKEKPLNLKEVLTKNYAWKLSIDSTLAAHKKTFPKTTENGLDSIRQNYEKKDGRYFFEKNQICFVVEKPYPYFVADTFEYDWEIPEDAKKITMTNVETGKEEWEVISFEKQKLIIKPVSRNAQKENANLVFVPAEIPKEEGEMKMKP